MEENKSFFYYLCLLLILMFIGLIPAYLNGLIGLESFKKIYSELSPHFLNFCLYGLVLFSCLKIIYDFFVSAVSLIKELFREYFVRDESMNKKPVLSAGIFLFFVFISLVFPPFSGTFEAQKRSENSRRVRKVKTVDYLGHASFLASISDFDKNEKHGDLVLIWIDTRRLVFQIVLLAMFFGGVGYFEIKKNAIDPEKSFILKDIPEETIEHMIAASKTGAGFQGNNDLNDFDNLKIFSRLLIACVESELKLFNRSSRGSSSQNA